jgi:diguanylate cyclase (GGDEF)-like protein
MDPERTTRMKLARRFLPFAAIGLSALLAPLLPPHPDDWTWVWIAAALTVAIAVAGFAVPWSSLPRWTYLVPPLAYFVVVACLRQANDGSVSGYAPLALLPVVWIALNLGRKEVAVGIGVGAAVFVLPLLVGDPASYTEGDWRRAVVWTAVAAIVGFAVEALVSEKRRQTRTAREQAAALADHQRTISAIAEVTRALTADSDARAQICEASLEIAEASMASIWEPDGSGELVLTGHAGPEIGRSRIPETDETSVVARAFESHERILVPEVDDGPSQPPSGLRRTRVVSILSEPILRSGNVVGVLSVGWARRVADIDERTARAVQVLAVDAAVAIERSDLLAMLSELADTDELTGLPNRRAWDETIRRAVGYATRTRRSLCVALIDLDHFKTYNDRFGHQAGDGLLKAAAAKWRTALRGTDTLARYGGEEFAVALPSCTAGEAQVVLERLRALTPDGQTCSVGVAEWIVGESPQELVERADRALYEAKHGGRDALVAAAA